MKYKLGWILSAIVLCFGCGEKPRTPRAKHVILIGLDAMSARGLQWANTPNFNYLMENGAHSMKMRCIRPTSSSQNWMSMVSGAIPEMHGVTDNDWEPDTKIIQPALKNKKGLFPTLFDHIREQRPDARMYLFYEWKEQDRMYDVSVADKAVTGLDYNQTFQQAREAFFRDKPEFLFVSINEPDHIGHKHGHESQEYLDTITYFDNLIGSLIRELEETGMDQETVLIVTADHGGTGYAHGGDSPAELEVPVLLFGGPVSKGKVIEPSLLICDIAATAGELLGVALPHECQGKMITDAFTPCNDLIYVPKPCVTPNNGFFSQPILSEISADAPDTEIYYTLDGSDPTPMSAKYKEAVRIDKPSIVRAITLRDGRTSDIVTSFIRVLPQGEQPKVDYKYYEDITGSSLPDFSRLGVPTREGKVYEFSLDELEVEEKDHFAVIFTTRLDIEETDQYCFGVISDDGSKVYLDGKQVIDNDGSHSADMKKGYVMLEKGLHELTVEYFDDYMGQHLELHYSSDKLPLQVVPFTRFKTKP